MPAFIVTIKSLMKDPAHDPENKVIGGCPVSDHCTDATGAHHSYLIIAGSVAEAEREARKDFVHITRIEEV